MSRPNGLWKLSKDYSLDINFWKDARFDIFDHFRKKRDRHYPTTFTIKWFKNSDDSQLVLPNCSKQDLKNKLGYVSHVHPDGCIDIKFNDTHYWCNVNPKYYVYMDIVTGPDPKMCPLPPVNWVKR